ncbi:MAG TPA: DEAD/DEAH box helicase, partial [Solibacterales bacterium]|nr:DEAD/DEAH box helicase [Bryobacterales bacterium]
MLDSFDPIVRDWFRARFGQPTEPQRRGWPEIAAGRDTLIAAPTGSGKTLSAFLISIDALVRKARANALEPRLHTVYVSPLKALSYDIRRNLEQPIAEMNAPLRVAVRTGDTPERERRQMTKDPPHILVTTPESLFILLTAESSRAMLRTARVAILDEIHAIAGDKRGSHLALSLARLDALAGRPQRIGLSATVRPIEVIARLLGDNTHIVNVGDRRPMDLAVEVPKDELGPIASNEMWAETYDRIAALIGEHRTTLVFVNTRRLAERVAHALSLRLGEGAVLPHHGSLSRQLRFDAESRLKSGELKAVVATASLELGIDIGSVDLVCQIGSPRSIAVGLQRFGRAGHWVGAIPKARLFPATRDELIESAALIRAIRAGELEEIEIPRHPLDILAQQIVAETSAEPWDEEALFDRFRTAWPYRSLERADFDAMVRMLSEGIATARGRSGALLHHDAINGRLRARRGARLAAITSGGAIPDNANYAVVLEPENKTIGTVDEDFAVESMQGDIFLLGTHSWKIRRVEPGRVRVEDAQGQAPSVPFWFGEAPGRSRELSHAVSELRIHIQQQPAGWAAQECGVDPAGAIQAALYAQTGAAMLGALPSTECVVAERFFDEAGGMQLVLHAPFGSRITRAWGLALRKRFCRTFNFELQAAATDNGLVLSLGEHHSFPLELVFAFLDSRNVEDVLTQALLAAPMFTARWRWNASRALVLPRFSGGRKVPAPIQRMRSEDLLAAVFPDQVACAENLTGPIRVPDHPLVRETIENCLREAMDIDGLKRVLEGIESGRIRTVTVDNAAPSPFSHEILNANPYAFLDDAPLEERRARAVQLRRTLREDVAGGAGVLDESAIELVESEVWPPMRDAEELHDALLTLVVLPPNGALAGWFEALCDDRRAFAFDRGGMRFWAAAERRDAIHDAVATLRGWLESTGPWTAAALAARLALTRDEVVEALARLEAEGQVLRGQFRFKDPGAEVEWCNRRVLARIHRTTLGRLRREIEPVSSAAFYRFLTRWHHLTPGAQLHGADGLLQIVTQLQGYEAPAAAWESEILPRRVAGYQPEHLDELCLSGEVMWARLSPPQSDRVRPTRLAPVSLFLRESAEWLLPAGESGEPAALSHPARDVLDQLKARGPSFFPDLVRGAHRLASEVEDALWELTAAALVTADGFENLRALLDPKRRRGQGSGRRARPRHAAGRWSLVRHGHAQTAGEARTEAAARQLLARWGVVFRDLLKGESLAPPWRDLLPVYRRLEARGEIRGGRFVAGFSFLI